MPQCAVITCRNAYHKTRGKVCYHRFPHEEELREKWITIIGRSDSKATLNTATARVCSLHFSPTCYDREIPNEFFGLPTKRRLKKGALPDRCVPKPISRRNKNKSLEDASKSSTTVTTDKTNSRVKKTRTVKKPKFDSEVYVDITSFLQVINRVTSVPEITVDVSQITNHSYGVLIALGLLPNSKSLNRMQIMDGSECDKSASVEEAAGKTSLLSEALLSAKDKTVGANKGPLSSAYGSNEKLELLAEALTKEKTVAASNGPLNSEELDLLAEALRAEKSVKSDEKPDEQPEASPKSENAEESGSVVVNGIHSEKPEEEAKTECPEEASPKEEDAKVEVPVAEEAMEVEEEGEMETEAEPEPPSEEGPKEAPPPPPLLLVPAESVSVVAEKRAENASEEAAAELQRDPGTPVAELGKEAAEKEEAVPLSDDEDGQSIGSCASQSNQVNEVDNGSGSGSGSGSERLRERKRRLENDGSSHGSDSDSALPQYKKTHHMAEDSVGVEEDAREKLVREYLEQSAASIDDMNQSAEKLQREISALGELARAKELEWNSILRLRKLKEEMLERLLRKRRQYFITSSNAASEWDNAPVPVSNSSSSIDKDLRKVRRPNINNPSMPVKQTSFTESGNSNLMMVPIVSSSPSQVPSQMNGEKSSVRSSSNPSSNSNNINNKMQRPILPKPPQISASALLDLQNSVIGEGRQGPILDVKSIIADYRSRHPETIPRRGRRPTGSTSGGSCQSKVESSIVSSTRFSGSPALMSMANLALGSGSHVRTVASSQDFPSNFMGHDLSRPSSADSLKNSEPNVGHVQSTNNVNIGSFKDFLVHFAKMKQENLSSQTPQINSNKSSSQPPPYPEVTLHPVAAPPSPPQTQTSLLHGILTKSNSQSKNNANSQHRPTAFSPTLARLLTAPEKNSRSMRFQESSGAPQFRPPVANNKNYNINDIFTPNKKSRNEITITPVSTISPIQKSKDEVVLLDDEEDGSDRLVIDEGAQEPVTEVPECQGCHQRSAQFVCAGCGNQWYCSRECQVEAWEEHSEMCSEH